MNSPEHSNKDVKASERDLFLEVKDDDDVWAERAYIYSSKKLALLDGWSFEK